MNRIRTLLAILTVVLVFCPQVDAANASPAAHAAAHDVPPVDVIDPVWPPIWWPGL